MMKSKILCLAAVSLVTHLSTAQDPRLSVEEAEGYFPLVPLAVPRVAAPSQVTYAPLMKKVTPSVVSIFSAIEVDLDEASPLDRFFGQGDEAGSEPGQRPMGSGSGVVLSKDGWIVTNSHVVHLPNGQLADSIKVQLHDRRLFRAIIVGVDPKTDLALLKISAKELEPIEIGDSRKVEVGDLVFAIGNPFRVGMTATMGMVSAVQRSGLGINGPGGYENFIQMDAAINPGNSGGALINAGGQLIGINTAIYGGAGGNVGIGFAIPSELMRPVVKALSIEGEVVRGFFGLKMREVTEVEARAAGLEGVYGAVVEEVMEDGPAQLAGLRVGDVVVKCGGVEIRSVGDFRLRLSLARPGERLGMDVQRGTELFGMGMLALKGASEVGEGKVFNITGCEGMKFVIQGEQVVIYEVDAEARKLGFGKGMALVSINGTQITSPAQAQGALRVGVNKIVTSRQGQTHTLALRIQE
ncbi:trypsin-like peptidase domain-containing protein [Verrucomicrobiaceae bacterium 227]